MAKKEKKKKVEYGRYKLMHVIERVNYTGPEVVEIGKVVDTESNEDVLYIDYDRNCFFNNGYHLTIVVYENETKETPVVVMDDLHRQCLYSRNDIFLALVLHEYGHYVNGDTEGDETIDRETRIHRVKEERKRCIANGVVMEEERKADAFAVRYVGKAIFLQALDYLIAKRRLRCDPAAEGAIKEFELRKREIRNM